MQKIKCKFAEWVLAPANAFGPAIAGEYQTEDGRLCQVMVHTVWNNTEGIFDNELDELCQEKFGFPFKTIRSVWISRLDRVDNYWHLVKMVEL